MKRLIPAMVFLMFMAWTAPAPGQLIFGKKAKVNPSQRVPELILIVKTDADERKRAHAAEELRDYDVTTFTEIVPVLADVLANDKKHGVRSEALTSLAKIRPVTLAAGQAIEKAAKGDDALLVRLQAKAALPKYHLAGYMSKKSEPGPSVAKKSDPPTTASKKKTTDEPPIASPLPAPRVDDTRIPRPLPVGPSLFPDK